MIDLTPEERAVLRAKACDLLGAIQTGGTIVPSPAWDDYVHASRPVVVLSLLDEIERLQREVSDLRAATKLSEAMAKKCAQGGAHSTAASEERSWICDFTSCTRVRSGRSRYCKMHRRRDERHGDPAIVLPVGRRKHG